MKSGKPSEFGRSDFRVGGAAQGGKNAHRGSRSILIALLVCVSLFSFSCRRPAAPPPPPPPEASAPPPPPPAPAITLTASPASIAQGASTTLEWTARNSNAVRIEPGIGDVPTSGTRSVSPTASVTYTATASGPGGTSTDTVRVTVNAAAPPAAAPAPLDQPELTIEELFNSSMRSIYFDYDQAEIRPDQVGPLQGNLRFLMQNQGIAFTISGHADERGSQEYNIGLGDRRANAVRQYLIDNGIGAGRINTVSFGEDRPVCTDTTEACYQRNRRAEFALR
jgi:peptidoglycan-associated lipoprotein